MARYIYHVVDPATDIVWAMPIRHVTHSPKILR